jgi:dipeptidase
VGAGPFRLPYRWRPLTWKVKDEKDAQEYFNERAVSTQQTGCSFVAQARSWLPDAIGGIFWFGVDDTYSTVYVPMYCGIRSVPKSYAVGTGSFNEFTWESAFWVFNFVANYAYSRYCDMIKDIQIVQRELEGKFLTMQPEVDKAALELYKKAPELARNYLTEYSVKEGDAVVKRWKKLGEFLLYKYLDGNVKTDLGKLSNPAYPSAGKVTHPGYPRAWYEQIVKETGDHFKVKPVGEKKEGH